MPVAWRDVLRTMLRLLTFRARREELVELDVRHLALGLACTWLVGMGRYWDDPLARVAQKLGLGSLIYVFALSLLLSVLLWPLRPKDWSYLRVLAFVSLVSPPAAVYAIPVERLMDIGHARSTNVLFLVVVATWRVSLLFFFLSRLARLRWYQVGVAGLLPLTAIVTSLFVLNLEHVVFDLMSGIRDTSSNDGAYEVLFLLTIASVYAVGPLLLLYLALIIDAWRVKSP